MLVNVRVLVTANQRTSGATTMTGQASSDHKVTGSAAAVPDDVASLVGLIQEFGPWALLGWRPHGGFAHRDDVDLRAVAGALERKL
ncbi:hypothetical protein AB0I84_32925 [Streptomyces spectabilis]|uniref:hypothetical protein n=1 Tax=Streptomyces spectabilis TaxID=68270 RepID=UPI0033D7F4A2